MTKNNDAFKIHVRNISWGWCRLVLYINDKEIEFNAGYTGNHPLTSLINACWILVDALDRADEIIEGEYISCQLEPGVMNIELTLDQDKNLHLDIKELEDEEKEVRREWHESIPFDHFVTAIISESFRVLNAFGLYGYRSSWMNQGGGEFPLASLLRIIGKTRGVLINDSYNSSFSEEIQSLQENISRLGVTEETKMKECVVYYESWQIQCCGDPFAVGDRVEWTGVTPSLFRNAHGTIIDMDEDHHGFATHSVTGTVTKIIAERSEFPNGKREVCYEKAATIQEERNHADGWESDLKSDNTTDRTFWGYVVTLKDAIVSPLKKK